MGIFFCTDILLDLIKTLDAPDSKLQILWNLCRRNHVDIYISDSSVFRALTGSEKYCFDRGIPNHSLDFIDQFKIIEPVHEDLKTMSQYKECSIDLLQMVVASRTKADFLVTYDVFPYRESKIPVISPSKLMEILVFSSTS